MHFSLKDLHWTGYVGGSSRAVIGLDTGDTVDNPASTKSPIYGPAVVTFDHYPDGGIDTDVIEIQP